MSNFFKGISPSLKAKICDHIFSAMVNKNEVILHYFTLVDEK